MEDSPNSKAPLIDIPCDVTFQDWRVILELVQKTLLPMELERIERMGSCSLRKALVTIMHRVYFLPILVPFLF